MLGRAASRGCASSRPALLSVTVGATSGTKTLTRILLDLTFAPEVYASATARVDLGATVAPVWRANRRLWFWRRRWWWRHVWRISLANVAVAVLTATHLVVVAGVPVPKALPGCGGRVTDTLVSPERWIGSWIATERTRVTVEPRTTTAPEPIQAAFVALPRTDQSLRTRTSAIPFPLSVCRSVGAPIRKLS